MHLVLLFLAFLLLALRLALPAPADGEAGLPQGWTEGVRLRPVLGDAERHAIHAYFNASPESPDGQRVLLYTSTTAEGNEGELWAVERATGKATVLAKNVVVEPCAELPCNALACPLHQLADDGGGLDLLHQLESSSPR